MPPPAKKRKTQAVEEITFDPTDRQDYLTGFHKRKLQRAKHAQDIAAKRGREEKIETRKHIREQRKKDLEIHVETVNALLKKAQEGDTDNETDHGTEQALKPEAGIGLAGIVQDGLVAGHEDEYVDEDRYTTVTVKAMDMSSDEEEASHDEEIEDVQENHGENDDQRAEQKSKTGSKAAQDKKRMWSKAKPDDAKPKKKKKKFRYESKVERKATRSKQKNKNAAAAKARKEKA